MPSNSVDYRLPISEISTHKSVNPQSLTIDLGDDHPIIYDGSSPVDIDLTSANKLNTDAGSSLTPVYFNGGIPVASDGNSIPFRIGTGTTAGKWLGELGGLNAYYDGLLILYKSPIAGGSSTTTLNINNLGAKTVYLNNTSKLTTHYPAN